MSYSSWSLSLEGYQSWFMLKQQVRHCPNIHQARCYGQKRHGSTTFWSDIANTTISTSTQRTQIIHTVISAPLNDLLFGIIWLLKSADHQPGCIRSHQTKTGWNYQLSTGAQFWPSTNYIIKVKDQRKGLSKSILVGLVPSIVDMLTNAYIEGLLVSSFFDVHRFSSSKEWPQPYPSPCSIKMTLPCRYWSSRLSFSQSVVANHGGYYW